MLFEDWLTGFSKNLLLYELQDSVYLLKTILILKKLASLNGIKSEFY
jgi:hypothetical protein